MRAIAEGSAGCGLAAAEPNLLGFGHLKLYRRQTGAPVGAIAEGLPLALAAGTPVIGAGLKVLPVRGLLGHFRMGFSAHVNLVDSNKEYQRIWELFHFGRNNVETEPRWKENWPIIEPHGFCWIFPKFGSFKTS
jgi:hypothetical protein